MRNVLKLTILCLLALEMCVYLGNLNFSTAASSWVETVPIRFQQLNGPGATDEMIDFDITTGMNTQMRYSVANLTQLYIAFDLDC